MGNHVHVFIHICMYSHTLITHNDITHTHAQTHTHITYIHMFMCKWLSSKICVYVNDFHQNFWYTHISTYDVYLYVVSVHTHIHTHIHTHTHTSTSTHVWIYTYLMDSDTHIYLRTHTITLSFVYILQCAALSLTHIHTHTQTYVYITKHIHTPSHIHTHTQTYVYITKHIHTPSRSHMCTYYRAHAHTHALSLSHTHTHSNLCMHCRAHTHTHNHMYAGTITLSHSCSCSLFLSFSPSYTLSHLRTHYRAQQTSRFKRVCVCVIECAWVCGVETKSRATSKMCVRVSECMCVRESTHMYVHTAGRSRHRGSGELGHPDQHRAALSATTFCFLEKMKKLTLRKKAKNQRKLTRVASSTTPSCASRFNFVHFK